VRVRVGLFRTTIGGPSLEAEIPERPLFRLVLTRFPGRLLWRLRTEASVRKAVRTGFTRPAHIPEAFVQHALEMTPGLRGSDARAAELPPAAEPPRPADDPENPAARDLRPRQPTVRSSLASAYQTVPGACVELLPGVGHSPMLEDPQTTGKLLMDFASAIGHPS
jgi:hypothetical protein